MKRTADYLNEVAQKSGKFKKFGPEEINKLRSILLEMYSDIKAVCDKHGIELLAGGGTCLGTIRHHGFIPWDDDMDFNIPREGYDKFKQIFDSELSKKYGITVPRNNKHSKTLYMQVYKKGTRLVTVNHSFKSDDSNAIAIDFFPIEKMPDNKVVRLIKIKLIDMLRIIALSVDFYQNKDPMFKQSFSGSIKSKLYYYLRKGIGLSASVFGRQNLYNFYDKFASSSKGSKYSSIPTGRGLCQKECHKTEVFFPPKKALFEGMEMLVPNDADSYLKHLYGDYMKIPPVEKREDHFYKEFDFGEE